MQGKFRTAIFGYSKKQVDTQLARMAREQEDALALRNDRFIEIRDKYNIVCNELAEYRRKEQEISSALIKAHTMATEIVREGERDAESEKQRLADEIKQLDRMAHALYSRIENAILISKECVEGFEQDLNELITRKEAFLKSTYGFDKESTADKDWKMSV
jgi:hypothetical protein